MRALTLGCASHSSAAPWPPKPDSPQVASPPSHSRPQTPSATFGCAAHPSAALGSAVVTVTSRTAPVHDKSIANIEAEAPTITGRAAHLPAASGRRYYHRHRQHRPGHYRSTAKQRGKRETRCLEVLLIPSGSWKALLSPPSSASQEVPSRSKTKPCIKRVNKRLDGLQIPKMSLDVLYMNQQPLNVAAIAAIARIASQQIHRQAAQQGRHLKFGRAAQSSAVHGRRCYRRPRQHLNVRRLLSSATMTAGRSAA